MALQGRPGKPKAPPTLLMFLQALEGKRVKVELHNETTIEGRLEEVSDSSDFSLEGGCQPSTLHFLLCLALSCA